MQEHEGDTSQGNKQEMHQKIGQAAVEVANRRVVANHGLSRLQAENTAAIFDWMEGTAQGFTEIVHDARNMVTALGLYCDLLEEPGVLSPSFKHYGSELKLLASASSHLVEKLMALKAAPAVTDAGRTLVPSATPSERTLREHRQVNTPESLPGRLIQDLAYELETNRNLLGALAGSGVEFTLSIDGGSLPVRMSSEDLTRVLVNLVRNAVEAMRSTGRLQIGLRELENAPDGNPLLLLSIEDNGPGVVPSMLDRIFEPGYTTRAHAHDRSRWQGEHLGLGLSITRSIIEAAGGRIRAAGRDPSGLCLQIELPVRTV